MIGLFCFVLAVLASPFRSKLRLEAENAVLRHQLIVSRRGPHGRLRLTNNDRWFFIQLIVGFQQSCRFSQSSGLRPSRWHRASFKAVKIHALRCSWYRDDDGVFGLGRRPVADEGQHCASATERPEDQMLPHDFLTVGQDLLLRLRGRSWAALSASLSLIDFPRPSYPSPSFEMCRVEFYFHPNGFVECHRVEPLQIGEEHRENECFGRANRFSSSCGGRSRTTAAGRAAPAFCS
jgi:hypothetical protein